MIRGIKLLLSTARSINIIDETYKGIIILEISDHTSTEMRVERKLCLVGLVQRNGNTTN